MGTNGSQRVIVGTPGRECFALRQVPTPKQVAVCLRVPASDLRASEIETALILSQHHVLAV